MLFMQNKENQIDLDKLTIKIFDSVRFDKKDRVPYITKVISGRLLAVVIYQELKVDDQIFERMLEKTDIENKGISEEEIINIAIHNLTQDKPGEIQKINHKEEGCFLLAIQEEDDRTAARILDPASMLISIVQVKEQGIICTVPSEYEMFAFLIGSANLQSGVALVAQYATELYDDQNENAISPWLYWCHGGKVEEIQYEFDEDDELSLNLPNDLLPLWQMKSEDK